MATTHTCCNSNYLPEKNTISLIFFKKKKKGTKRAQNSRKTEKKNLLLLSLFQKLRKIAFKVLERNSTVCYFTNIPQQETEMGMGKIPPSPYSWQVPCACKPVQTVFYILKHGKLKQLNKVAFVTEKIAWAKLASVCHWNLDQEYK